MPTPAVLRHSALFLVLAGMLPAQVTTRDDVVGKLLNQWHKEGAAAGLTEITYENRDGGHSQLPVKEWPQLKVHTSDPVEKGPALQVRPMPVIGNCSMAASAKDGGSLPRLYYLQQPGFDFLTAQYLGNNLFIYPEHQDHDPGWNGQGGYGDLYPANTPLLTISQGSSGTDQPFVRAFLSAAAAFPPETQKLLIEKRLLAPTLQQLLRRSQKPAPGDDDYFTGEAHPVVFNGADLDLEKMVTLAHAMTPMMVPPVAILEVGGETALQPGRDFFELDVVKDGVLANSPCNVARIFRGAGFVHELLLTTRRSVDVQGRVLQFKWVVLQGDINRVRIETADNGSTAKVTVAWHPERSGVRGIQTHRVDIGVFAHNGMSWSAPSFVTFYMLPDEVRFYTLQGKLEEIRHGSPPPDPGLPPPTDLRWLALGRRLKSDPKHPGIALPAHMLSEIAIVRLESIANDLAADQENFRRLSQSPDHKAAADKLKEELGRKISARLHDTFDGSGRTLLDAVEGGLLAVADIPDLYLAGQDVIPALVKESGKPDAWNVFLAARQRLVDYEIYRQVRPGVFDFAVKPGSLTDGERHHLRLFHQTVLHLALLPEFLDRAEDRAFSDPRLASPKDWRDVYRYDKEGKPVGWTRFSKGRTYEFDAEGRLLPQGRGGPALPVQYVRDEKTGLLIFVPRAG